jgi:hypothetical protein
MQSKSHVEWVRFDERRKLRLSAVVPRLDFGSRPSGTGLTAVPAARETLAETAMAGGF